jgi:CRISPR type III-B/RAMP module-associated protein Cmr5
MDFYLEDNLEHKRAAYAYSCVKDIIDNHNGIKEEYRSEVLQTATRLKNIGLLQTLAFYSSKMEKKKHFLMLNLHLMKWALRDDFAADIFSWDEDKDAVWQMFHDNFLGDSSNLMLYTERALAMVTWLKRFADGRIKKPSGGE